MARETGLEPATSGVTGRRSNQLSYSPARSEPIRHEGGGKSSAHAGAALAAVRSASKRGANVRFRPAEQKQMRSGASNSARRTSAGLTPIWRRSARARDHRRRSASPAPGVRPASVSRPTCGAAPTRLAGGATRRDRAHQRIDAGRHALARRPAPTRARRGEAGDDDRGAQLAELDAELHRGDDIAAGRIDQHDHSAAPATCAACSAKSMNACGVSGSITPSATMTLRASGRSRAIEAADAERHRRLRGRRRGGGEPSSAAAHEPQQRRERMAMRASPRRCGELVGGDGLEPPTLSV